MARLVVSIDTVVVDRGPALVGTMAGRARGGEAVDKIVRIRTPSRRFEPVLARVFISENGVWREVAKRNMNAGFAEVRIRTNTARNPVVSVVSESPAGRNAQLESGPVPPGVIIGGVPELLPRLRLRRPRLIEPTGRVPIGRRGPTIRRP